MDMLVLGGCPLLPDGMEFPRAILSDLRRRRLIEPDDDRWHLRHTDHEGPEDEARADELTRAVAAAYRLHGFPVDAPVDATNPYTGERFHAARVLSCARSTLDGRLYLEVRDPSGHRGVVECRHATWARR